MDEGFIKIHRKILKSELMDCHANTLKVFLILLCMADWQDKPGTIDTTLDHLAHLSRLSINSVRGTLRNLSNMQILTHRGTLRGTYKGTNITILKYSDYQFVGTRDRTREGTHKGTTTPYSEGTNTPLRSNVLRIKEEKKYGDKLLALDLEIEKLREEGKRNGSDDSKSNVTQTNDIRTKERLKAIRAQLAGGKSRKAFAGVRDSEALQAPEDVGKSNGERVRGNGSSVSEVAMEERANTRHETHDRHMRLQNGARGNSGMGNIQRSIALDEDGMIVDLLPAKEMTAPPPGQPKREGT